MELCIVTGSIRKENTTQRVAEVCTHALERAGVHYSLLSLEYFTELFTGSYLYCDDASPEQERELEKMRRASILLFIVPTYYRAMPGVLKNFFDLVRSPEVYADKTIAFISSNHKNQDYGALQTYSVIQALLAFFKIRAVLVPEILIQNPASIDAAEVKRFLEMVTLFTPQEMLKGSS